MVLVLFTILRNSLIRPLSGCWREPGMKWTRILNYTYCSGSMSHQRSCEMSWQSIPSIKNVPITPSTWSLKFWLRLMNLECLIHVDEIQQHPENNVGVDFSNIIHLIRTGQHYDLLQEIIDVDDVPYNDEEKEQIDGDCMPRLMFLLC